MHRMVAGEGQEEACSPRASRTERAGRDDDRCMQSPSSSGPAIGRRAVLDLGPWTCSRRDTAQHSTAH
ncbi:hypothetical protein GQ55_9G135500 [Panicum hallii var. hallii]|uniref:Uncharacterized protein n=1 Tax=Panicum hallii var. hallii TaxID=1504633 RepID=A0A2T7C2U7_9POAL|nr:hypothetical protein GQ55_9G135500 [Panicum hallii var. hallii]